MSLLHPPEHMLAPMVSGQAHLGALIADFAGMRGIESYTTEAAGASGGAALRAGYLAIKSGFVDTALVVGVEKFTDKVGPDVEAAISTSLDSDFEAVQGLTPVSQAALLMNRYLNDHNVPRETFGAFPVPRAFIELVIDAPSSFAAAFCSLISLILFS